MQYELKALSSRQEIAVLSLEAPTLEEASSEARRQGYIVLSVTPKATVLSSGLNNRSKFPLLLFSQELRALLDAGLSLMESMETLREKQARTESRRVMDRLLEALYEGLPLSGALEQQSEIFPALYVALIRSSEQTGDLAESLSRYVDYQLQIDIVRKKIVSASIYPALLIVVGGLVTMFLMLYVVPKFSTIFESSGRELPFLSQLLLSWGRMLHEHATEFFATSAIILAGLVYVFSRPALRAVLLKQLWRIPAVGAHLHVYQLARFYRTLGMLLKGGIPIMTAMEMVKGLLQPAMREHLQLAAQDVREGITISVAMEQRGLTTPVAMRMLRVGERSGKMGEMMERIGLFYDEEVARWVDWFTKLFEPILMTIIGLVVGLIVTLMYMPIFELAGNIQ
jgi:general secretion pathway protein F